MPAKLAAGAAEHRMIVPRAAPATETQQEAGAAAACWVLPNLSEVLAAMVQMGGGLVQAARLPRSADGLRLGLRAQA